MKRRAFILTEILTGMMLQVMFAVVLCSAFYMILNFSTYAQQGFSANDKGQMVIAYFDSRIRNAGLGMWRCGNAAGVRASLANISGLQNTNLCLPVAIARSDDSNQGVISYDSTTGVYSGNVVTLLYAHKDTSELDNNSVVRLILLTNVTQQTREVSTDSGTSTTINDFQLIDNQSTNNVASYVKSNFYNGGKNNIKSYAVMESSGIPVYTRIYPPLTGKSLSGTLKLRAPSASGLNPVTVYPMSEMLNLECQKLYTMKDDNGYNFVFRELNTYGEWDKFYYHTKDILDLYMTLNTRPNTPDRVPVFELRVLVSEGINENGTTSKPQDWPGRWPADFSTHKVHVSKAAWKLYNLAPLFP